MYKKKAAESKRKNNFDEIENNDKGRIIEKIYEYKEKYSNIYIGKNHNLLKRFTKIFWLIESQ